MFKKQIPIQDAESDGMGTFDDNETAPDAGASELPTSASEQSEAALDEKSMDAPCKPQAPEMTEEEKLRESENCLKDRLLRLAAEFENYKKKNAGEYSRGRARGIVDAAEAILPSLDSLGAALQTAEKEHDAAAMLTGMQAVQRQMQAALTTLGLAKIDVKEGEALDPNFHEVVFMQPSDTVVAGKVLRAVREGYTLGGHLVRPAKVICAKEPDPPA